jgi:hypothetical protein
MKIKGTSVALLFTLFFILGFAGISFSADLVGTITKIDQNKVTIKDQTGKETTIAAKDITDLKLGYKVKIIEVPTIKGNYKIEIIDIPGAQRSPRNIK